MSANHVTKFLLVLTLLLCTSFVRGQPIVYVNYSSDLKNSMNGVDSKIVIDPKNGGYRIGHNFGRLSRCGKEADRCHLVDFLAFLEPGEMGSKSVAPYDFRVGPQYEISVLGNKRFVQRVDVMYEGKPANAYLYDRTLGVIAIFVPDFSSKDVRESFFLLSGEVGLFAPDIK